MIECWRWDGASGGDLSTVEDPQRLGRRARVASHLNYVSGAIGPGCGKRGIPWERWGPNIHSLPVPKNLASPVIGTHPSGRRKKCHRLATPRIFVGPQRGPEGCRARHGGQHLQGRRRTQGPAVSPFVWVAITYPRISHTPVWVAITYSRISDVSHTPDHMCPTPVQLCPA